MTEIATTAQPTPLPTWLARQFPFAPHAWTTPEGRLHYLDEGVGEAVLMLHGNPTWSFYYRGLVEAWRERFRCVVPDHLGCGRSDHPDGARYDLRGHIDRLESLVRGLALPRFHLVVHDWGGAIGFGLAARMPERVGRILILNTAAFRSSRLPWRIAVCRWPILGEFLVRGLNGFVRAATVMTTVRRLPAEVRRAYLWPFPDWDARRAVWHFVRDIPRNPAHPSHSTLVEIEQSLARWTSQPALLAWGGRDWCFDDSFLAEWRRRLPRAAVHRFPEAGHWVLEDAGREIAGLGKRFLEG